MNRTPMIALAMALSVSTMPALADTYCNESLTEYFELTVHNSTNQWLLIDLGIPEHGWDDFDVNGPYYKDDSHNRYVRIAPDLTGHGVICSGGFMTGLESYVRLYGMPGKHYLEEWDVDQPYIGRNKIRYYDDNNRCRVDYYTQSWGADRRPHVHNTSGEKPELSEISNHSHIEQLDVWC